MKFRHLLERGWAIVGAVSVRTKIMGIALGLVLLFGLGTTLYVRAALTTALTTQLEGQSVTISRDLAARSTDLIFLNDIYSLQRLLLETQTNDPNIRYAFIVDRQGYVLAHTFEGGFPANLLEINAVNPEEHHKTVVLETNEGLVWDTAVPIFGGRAGVVRVGFSDVEMRKTLNSVTGQLILITALVSAIGVTAAALLTWILTRPILELARTTERIAAGDFTPRIRRWADDEIGNLAEAFNHMTAELARTDELRREREQLRRQLLEKVIATQEDERKRIARELHDSTSQSLTSMMVGLRALEDLCDQPEMHEQVSVLRAVVAQTLDEVHALAVQLRPAVLDDLGLPAALERLVNDWQARHKIHADSIIHIGEGRLPGEVETALYRIVQEALTNAARHAEARSVSVLVERRGAAVVAVIEDDGKGFAANAVLGEKRLGLLGMRERAELLDGRLTVESGNSAGTSIFVEIPLITDSPSPPFPPRRSDELPHPHPARR